MEMNKLYLQQNQTGVLLYYSLKIGNTLFRIYSIIQHFQLKLQHDVIIVIH